MPTLEERHDVLTAIPVDPASYDRIEAEIRRCVEANIWPHWSGIHRKPAEINWNGLLLMRDHYARKAA